MSNEQWILVSNQIMEQQDRQTNIDLVPSPQWLPPRKRSPVPSPLIEIRNISKQYPNSNKKANNSINLQIKKGEILCIAGENGAGKTTLMKILCGLEMPDEGEIYINGRKEEITSALEAKKLGIGMVHQHFTLFGEYTAAENIVMGYEPRKWGLFFNAKKADSAAQEIINRNSFNIECNVKVKDLTLGQMQQVEICRVLYQNAQIIILDEPTSILTEQETQGLFKTIKQLASDGKTIIFITHKLQEIKQICGRAAVLKEGELVGVLEGNDLNEDEIAELIKGLGARDQGLEIVVSNQKKEQQDELTNIDLVPSPKPLVPIISFENVTVKRKNQHLPLLDNISFTVHSGEILGFTGTGGNGLGVIEAVLGGFLHPAQGKVLHRGKDISHLSIRALRNNGLAFVPADRKLYGSAKDMTIEENMIINRRGDFFKKGFINKKEAQNFSQKLIQGYNIQGNPKDSVSVLSGGNLQKLILAREIDSLKDYIVFSEPTWGLDIAAQGFIMKEITSLKEKGAAVILISTNMEEVYALADRVIVMEKGKIATQ